jgi:hypothetical protein
MIAEHIVFSGALAILVGMIFYKYTGRDPSWIIVISAWAPDLDVIANPVLRRLGFRVLFEGSPIYHGTFHTIGVMVIFGIAMAFLLHPLGIKFFDSLFFSIIGFGAHLVEDALVYKLGYKFLWPLSSQILGIGLFPDILNEDYYIKDFFGIANTEVLIIGLVLLLTAFLIRTYYEGSLSWLRWYLPNRVYRAVFVPENR